MTRSLVALTLALTVLPGIALAHGPSRQKHATSIEVDMAPAAVWQKIGNFDDLSWNPLVASVKAEPGNAVNSVREVTLKDGGVLRQELYKYDAKRMSYQIQMPEVDTAVLPVTNYSEFLTVKPVAGSEKSEIEIRSAYYRGYPNNEPPENLNDKAANDAVAAMQEKVVEGLKASLENGS
ncbi:SRPBCC family protein [Aureimonas sp. OT7]|uniref:SRPBCC family protein n=1 Tax=Aureimonas TaxID=414371 RepID=UPI0009DD15CD|nr:MULTISPECIES: SRPBCC family protein [Aureimonas]QOG07699.1 SRPBCC family protein [Aureimonas sp. OT7]